MRKLATLICAAHLAGFPVHAANLETIGEPELESRHDDQIVVTGQDVRKATKSFVDRLDIPEFNGQYARWDVPVCLEMTGWQPEHADRVRKIIESTTIAIGHEVAAEGCKPNMAVVLTADPDAFVTKLKKAVPSLFSRFEKDQREAVQNSDQPVRMLLGARLLNSDGRTIALDGALRPPPGLSDLRPYSDRIVQGTGVGDSRIETSIKYDFVSGVAIVDVNKIDGLTFEGLASYIAMRFLSGIPDRGAPVEGQSILNLFQSVKNTTETENGLSQWDTAFLKGLYTGKLAMQSRRKRYEIAKTMTKVLDEE